ncbi:hypothetical protein PORCRE_1630 [Porphyromonas crevioricanis JCM 15906]|uniref:Uncharacterized protein n=1 Tax=Porphyromonas crevioricanis JCM 15906 TaxID=1305617 RepID=T1DSZ2_9PORP|nr:hypothetical protein PORCRE_1630 [Porphyromonas crevioricanis JCM 15906]
MSTHYTYTARKAIKTQTMLRGCLSLPHTHYTYTARKAIRTELIFFSCFVSISHYTYTARKAIKTPQASTVASLYIHSP